MASSADPRYQYTGKERDAESGLDYFGARYYDSWRGQWLSVDPVADKYPGWSPYCYAVDNPISNIDKEGKYAVKAIGGYIFASRINPHTIGVQQGLELIPGFIGPLATGVRGLRNDRWWTPSATDYAESFFGEKLLGKVGNTLLGGAQALSDQNDLIEAFNTDKEVFDQLLSEKIDGKDLFLKMEAKDIYDGNVTLGESNGEVIMLNPDVINDPEFVKLLEASKLKTGEEYVNWKIDDLWKRKNPTLYEKQTRRKQEHHAEDQYNAEYGAPPDATSTSTNF